jgi:hypothetical protein
LIDLAVFAVHFKIHLNFCASYSSMLKIFNTMARPIPQKIDIHSHVVPPSWKADVATHCHSRPNGMTRDPVIHSPFEEINKD